MEVSTLLEIGKDVLLFIIGFVFFVIERITKKNKINKIETKNAILNQLPDIINETENKVKGKKMGETRKFCVESAIKEQYAINHLKYNEDEIRAKIEQILATPQATCYKNDKYEENVKEKNENGEKNQKSEIRPEDLLKHSEEDKEN